MRRKRSVASRILNTALVTTHNPGQWVGALMLRAPINTDD